MSPNTAYDRSGVSDTAASTDVEMAGRNANSGDNEVGAPQLSAVGSPVTVTYGSAAQVTITLDGIHRESAAKAGFPQPQSGGYLAVNVTVHAVRGSEIIIRPYRTRHI